MPRINQCSNPSAQVDVSNWRAATWTRVTGESVGDTGVTTCGSIVIPTSAYGSSGAAGGALTTAESAGGLAWSYVGWLKSSVAVTVVCSVSRYNGSSWASPTFAGSGNINLVANTWTRVRGTGTNPTGGTYDAMFLHVDFPSGGAAGNTLRVGAVRLEQISDSALDYRDGNSSGWMWTGTPGLSVSQESSGVAGPEPGRFLLAV